MTEFSFFEVTGPDLRVEDLLARHHADMQATSDEASCHVMTSDALRAAGAQIFALSFGEDVYGIGALKPLGGHDVELKSMHTIRAARGKGIGRRMVDLLMRQASAMGADAVYLETGSGPAFVAARALYENTGFVYCEPFADYEPDPLSVFMVRRI